MKTIIKEKSNANTFVSKINVATITIISILLLYYSQQSRKMVV